MRRFRYVTYAVVVLATLLALGIVGRWADSIPGGAPTLASTDWVQWTEGSEGALVARYVQPGSPAAQAGLRAGDRLYMFSYHPYRDRDTLHAAVASVPPGERRAYHVLREGRFERITLPLTTQPAFLYPLSSGLWSFSLWGFGFCAFFHLLGLIVVIPLVQQSRRARLSLGLLAVSSLWVMGTLVRLLIVEAAGLPAEGTSLRILFEVLAAAGVLGWIAFPALLLDKVVCDTQEAAGQHPTRLRFAAYAPLAMLLVTALSASASWTQLPHTLAAPVLLYTCCFIAASAALVLAHQRLAPASVPDRGWSDTGGAFLLVSAVIAAGVVLFFVPFAAPVTQVAVGGLVVTVELLSTVPVVLLALATFRHATLGTLLTRALTYVAVLGAIFFSFVGGFTVIEAFFDESGTARNVAVGLFVVVLLLVFERVARRLRLYASRFFATGPQRAREALSRFQEQMRTILTHEALAQETATVVGEAFGARSVRLFLHAASDQTGDDGGEREGGASSGWIIGTHHPEPPYFTEQHFERIWPYMRREGRVWARNPELRDSTLPEQRAQMLEERGVALAMPIIGEGEPVGLLAMGGKEKRGELYSHADLDLLRFLAGQLTLAAERLDLVARERALVRASAQAELAALRAQINPHFLFNALNTIASLIAVRPDEAEETVEHLAAIFRHILQTGSQSFVPLEEELALVRHYLHIEQVRFGKALTVEIDLPPALAHRAVPAFAVQTLVENAVKHGIAKKRGGGRVRITVRHVGDSSVGDRSVEVVVDDTGAGIEALFSPPHAGDGSPPAHDDAPPPETSRTSPNRRASHPSFYGIGLCNVADRLERLYARDDLLRLTSASGEGTTATLHLPPAPDQDDDSTEHRTPPEALRHV